MIPPSLVSFLSAVPLPTVLSNGLHPVQQKKKKKKKERKKERKTENQSKCVNFGRQAE